MFHRSVVSCTFVVLCTLGAGLQLSAQSSILLTSAVTTRVPVPGNNCAVPPTETNFLTTDNRVWIVFSYTGGSAGDTDFVEWFDPSGNLYVTSTFQQAVSGGTNCLGYYIGISGFAPASQPGNWRVRLRSNNTEVFSRPFTISAPTASTLALASNTTLPQATVGAPYTFSFTASGGTAPYKWSLSSGQTPPGLTLSTAGVLSGTATSAASYVLALHVADSAGNSLDRDIGLGVSLPALQIGVGSLAFSFTQNGTAPKSQTFSLASNGAALPFTLKTDQNWLSATPASGSTPGTVTVSVQPQGLTPGSYQGNVTVQSSASSTSSQTVAVNLAVFPPGTGTPGGVIRTFAGTDFTFSIAGGKALNAPLGQVYGLAMDSSGNVYAPDYQNHVVVKIAPNGTASVIAGNGLQGFSGDGAAAVNASLNGPGAVGIDKAGNLYIADTFNNRIRRVSPDGTITTIAGSSTFGFAGDNGPAVNALLFFPSALVADPAGNVYFSDFGNARIRKIDGSTGRITTIAGNGKTSYSGEGAATSVSAYVFNQMAVDSLGNLYFSDLEHHVRKLTTSGQTVLIAGNGQGGFSGENVAATGAALNVPAGLAVDSGGRVFIADFNNGRIRVIDSYGLITTFAGLGNTIQTSGDNGPALHAGMNPVALTIDSSGVVYLADYATSVIRKIDTSGIITTIAGNNLYRSAPDGTVAANAFFNNPDGLAADRSGNVIVADSGSNRIRKVTSSGIFSTIAGAGAPGCCGDGLPATQASLATPSAVVVDAQNNIYFSDSGNHRVRKIAPDGTISTVAGAGTFSTGGSFDGDGASAKTAHLDTPHGVALDGSGTLYIADTGNNVVRRVAPDGTISTYAGTPQKPGFSGDNGPANKAQLNAPYALALDTAGNLYIADSGNHSIRMVAPNGTLITTVAGNQKAASSGDGGSAKNASINQPKGITVDPSGNLYILETGGHRVRQVTPAGVITTIAGTGIAGFSGDGGPSIAAQISGPQGSLVFQNGALYFTDTGNQRVRGVSLGGATAAVSSFVNVPTSIPSLTVSPTSLTFTAVSSGAATNPMTVQAGSSTAGLPVQISATTTSGGSWLQVDTSSANCPANIGVRANPAGLAAGTYQGTVTVSTPYSTPPQVNIAVTFTVTAASAGHLSIDTTPLSYKVVNGASPITAQIALSNSGSGSLQFTAATRTASAGSWLAVTPSSGTVSASAPTGLSVTLAPGSLAAGVYSGVITVSSPDNADPPQTIQVTLLVANPVPVILLSQAGLTFQAAQGGGNPLPQDIEILNEGQGSMNWTATAQTLSGGNWLSISPASGTVTTPFVSFSTTSVSVNAAGLAPGNYFGQIQVRADGASNSPQTISVVLNVFGQGTPLAPEVRPSGLVFIGSKDNPPGSQTVSIGNRGTATFGYTSNKLTFSNINWITNAPVAGSVPMNSPARITVQPDLSQRQPGVDRGVITILFNDGTTQTVSILSVVPPPGFAPNGGTGGLVPHASGGCNPTQLLGQITNPSSTNVPLGQPVSLEVRLTDDCGNLVTDKYPASINVAFSTGEPGLTMQHTSNGKWSKTWQPMSTKPSTVMIQFTSFASAANGKILASLLPLSVTLTSAAQVPLVNPGGIQNAASYSATPVVSPGGLIAILGNTLADPTGQVPPPGQAPTSLGHTQVKVGDQLLPLFFTSNSQLNAQVPFNLPVNSQQQLVVQYGNSLSVPAALSVAAAQPAIFSQDQSGTGQGSITNGVTNILADSGHPVHAGDVISVYCTGLGPVSPGQPAGSLASTTVLSRTMTPVTATIGGKSGTVQFAGLAPGLVGVYQVNVLVPGGVTPGDAVPVVLTEGSQVSPAVTIAVR